MQAHLHQASTHHTAAVPIRGTSTHLLRLLVEVSLQLVDLTLLHFLLAQHVVDAARLQTAQRAGWAIEWMGELVAAQAECNATGAGSKQVTGLMDSPQLQ